jgi:ATP-binding cassette subfamily F protein uup
VSHDRAFLDSLCTSTLVFEERGILKEYVGGYSDWKRAAALRKEQVAPTIRKAKITAGDKRPEKPRKLTYAERSELDTMPARIEALERELAELHTHMTDPEFYKQDPEAMRRGVERAGNVEVEIEAGFARWAELSERSS